MKSPLGIAGLAGAAILGVVALLNSTYIVKEGHIGVKTSMGKAISQEAPNGLQFKIPFIQDIKQFDVRERRLAENMAAATQNQLPITAEISMSWNMDPTRVLEVFRKYGSPERFEANILRPRIRQAAKAGLSRFQASDLIKDRTTTANTIQQLAVAALEDYPAFIPSLQIEQVVLPPRYLEAVMAKEEAREGAAKEQYELDKQKLIAQREVQTAIANRDAAIARADGEAYRIEAEATANAKAIIVQGDAQAAAIEAQTAAIGDNPLIIDYERARRWNGVMPKTVLGESTNMLMKLPD